ncbi:MAG: lytic transglycosylase domain-containing protein [Gammaproteobacteria bacterium]|nr:lytic transglycosylase domain-containing protein [Gammaproteobacteria bacterium]
MWHHCFGAAAQHYRIAPELLIAIARTESGLDPLAVHHNPDGSWDVGLMQINSRWLPALREMGFAAESLYEPCTSIWVGAWVLAGNIHRLGYTWQAVGAYNAGTARSPSARERREAYARRVAHQLGPPAVPARPSD